VLLGGLGGLVDALGFGLDVLLVQSLPAASGVASEVADGVVVGVGGLGLAPGHDGVPDRLELLAVVAHDVDLPPELVSLLALLLAVPSEVFRGWRLMSGSASTSPATTSCAAPVLADCGPSGPGLSFRMTIPPLTPW